MKKVYLVSCFVVTLVFMLTYNQRVNSEIPAPPVASNGTISGVTCARSGCHTTTPAQIPATGDLKFQIGTGNPTLDITNNFQYTPGTIYNIAFLPQLSGGRYGFQVSAVTSSNGQAGTLAIVSATNTSTSTLAGITYLGHKNADSFKNWTFKWTAPAAGTGPVTFHYAFNIADGDDSRFNDDIYVSSVTIQEAGNVGIQDMASFVTDITTFPNPVNQNFSLSFNMLDAGKVTATVFSLDGKLQKELLVNEQISSGLFNQSFDLSSLSSGIYSLQISTGKATTTQKFVKL